MKFTDFIVEMDNMSPSQPERVDKPVQNATPKILKPNKKLITPPAKEYDQTQKQWVEKEKPEIQLPKVWAKQINQFGNAPNVDASNIDRNDNFWSHFFEGLEESSENLKRKVESDPRSRKRFEELKQKKPSTYKNWNTPPQNEEERKWRMRDNHEFTKLRQLFAGDQIGIQDDAMMSLYTGDSYTNFNNFLRYGHFPKKDPFGGTWDVNTSGDYKKDLYIQAVDWMKNAIERQEEYTEKGTNTYYRGLRNNPFENLSEGDIISDPAFMSTSKNINTATSFGDNLMKISSSGGYDIFPWQRRSGEEYETIFSPNSRLRYLGRTDEGEVMAHNFESVRDDDMKEQINFNIDESEYLSESPKTPTNFHHRMADFHFMVHEKPTNQPSKKYDEFRQQLDHDD